jgi:hypothetical protein
MTRCLSAMSVHFGQAQSRHLQNRLWPFSADTTPWLRHRAHFGVLWYLSAPAASSAGSAAFAPQEVDIVAFSSMIEVVFLTGLIEAGITVAGVVNRSDGRGTTDDDAIAESSAIGDGNANVANLLLMSLQKHTLEYFLLISSLLTRYFLTDQ